MKFFKGFFLASFLFAAALGAEEVLTLEKCIKLAFEGSDLIKIAAGNVAVAEGLKKEAFGNFLPEVTAWGTYTRLDHVPGIAGFKMGDEDNYAAKMILKQPIFTWGKIHQGWRLAGFKWSISRAEKSAAEKDLLMNVKKTFYTVLLSGEMKEIAQESYNVIKKHYEVSRALYEAGKVSSIDVSRVKVEMVNRECALIKAENEWCIAGKALLNLINYKPAAEWKAGGTLEECRAVATGELPELLERAFSSRPELAKAEGEENAGKSFLKIARSENKPNLVFAGNYEYSNPYNFEKLWDKSWNVAVSLNFTFFNGLSNRGRINQAEARMEQIICSRRMLENNIKLEVEKAFLKRENALRRVDAQKENVGAAKQNLEIVQARYAQGLVSDIELRDAELALSNSQMEYSTAFFDLNTAQAELDRASGKE